jgi:uncharacterized protein YhaN
MRFNRIDLTAFGKFDCKSIDLPRSAQDFHLIVGANEAGKSTMRRGIKELLFGMPRQTSMGFKHLVSELKLGAELQAPHGSSLDFIRDHTTKAPLKTKEGVALRLDALLPFLGATSEQLFEKLFCLDLDALIDGSKSILNASDDVGQLLFQSAAGISSLGALKQSLEKEAEELFGPRKSDRAVYRAIDEHDKAKAALKEVMVSTKTWLAADGELRRIVERLAEMDEARRLRSAENRKLERVRRLATEIAKMRDLQAQLDALGEVAEFPDGAAKLLEDGLRTLLSRTATVEGSKAQVEQVEAKLRPLQGDDEILRLRSEVDNLVSDAQRAIDQRRDLVACRTALAATLKAVGERASELGWPQEEAALRSVAPTSLALKSVTALLTERGGLEKQAAADDEAKGRAEAALQKLRARLELPTIAPVSQAFKAALRNAQALGKAKERIRASEVQIEAAESALESALSALHPWRMEPDALRALSLPTVDRVARSRTQKTELELQAKSGSKLLSEAEAAQRKSELALGQAQRGQHVVLLEEVMAARSSRDAAWNLVKSRAVELDVGASEVDRTIRNADTLVDAQRDTAEQSARYQALKDDAEKRALEVELARAGEESSRQALADFEVKWDESVAALNLPGMHIDDLAGWMSRLGTALEADRTLQDRRSQLESESLNETAALEELRKELLAVQVEPAPAATLETLCALAEEHQRAAGDATVTRSALSGQVDDAETAFDSSKQTAELSARAYQEWQQRWSAALESARLTTAVTTFSVAAAAVEVATEVLGQLSDIDNTRSTRIDAMEEALARFEVDATAIRGELGIAQGEEDSIALADRMRVRLADALRLQSDIRRLDDDLEAANRALKTAGDELEQAKAALQPLYDTAGTEDDVELRAKIAAFELRRSQARSLKEARAEVIARSDGLSLEDVESEVATISVAEAEVRQRELQELENGEQAQRDELTQLKVQAQQRLALVDGGPKAAVAESKRIEALAQMTDATERYVKVASAAKVLSWVIERYRERRQGPMLHRAGVIFSEMTGGRYVRLAVEPSDDTPKLIAVRETDRVGIEGLSDGTRDQLFLALRLAALEIHVEGDRPVPFIADDLFVNFHDGRAEAGLKALAELSRKTQVVFLTHHEHLVPIAQRVLGPSVNLVRLD